MICYKDHDLRLSHRLAAKLRRMEQLFRVSELEDEFEALLGAAGASHKAPEVRHEEGVPIDHFSRVQWRKAPVVQTTDQAKAALANVRWRTAGSNVDVETGRGNITTAAKAAKRIALTVGVRGNPEAPAVLHDPAVLHNKATRDISEHTGSRER